MGVVPRKNHRKPKLKKGDTVLVVDMPDGPETFRGVVSEVENIQGQIARVKKSPVEFSETGMSQNKRAVLIPASIKASWGRSSFLKNQASLGSLVLNIDMLTSIDEENEKLS